MDDNDVDAIFQFEQMNLVEGAPADAPSTHLAERTGLEPATSGVTGRHSNQLNYGPAARKTSLLPPRVDPWVGGRCGI